MIFSLNSHAFKRTNEMPRVEKAKTVFLRKQKMILHQQFNIVYTF
jgi:hypothetical protein